MLLMLLLNAWREILQNFTPLAQIYFHRSTWKSKVEICFSLRNAKKVEHALVVNKTSQEKEKLISEQNK